MISMCRDLYGHCRLVRLVLIVQLIARTQPVRLWKTIYMDNDDRCESYIRNDDMSEGDFYMVKSDNWQGRYQDGRRPAECSQNFNFGDRFIAVRLVQWWCNEPLKEPFLSVYDSCNGQKTNLLAMYNCSRTAPMLVHSTASCVMLYHYRGHQKAGYYFALEVSAKHEIIAFPAGGIAAIIIGVIITLLVLLKVICVLTGWEEKMPTNRLHHEDDTKFIIGPDEGSIETIAELQTNQAESIFVEGEPPESCQTLLPASERTFSGAQSASMLENEVNDSTDLSEVNTAHFTLDETYSEYDNVDIPWKKHHHSYSPVDHPDLSLKL